MNSQTQTQTLRVTITSTLTTQTLPLFQKGKEENSYSGTMDITKHDGDVSAKRPQERSESLPNAKEEKVKEADMLHPSWPQNKHRPTSKEKANEWAKAQIRDSTEEPNAQIPEDLMVKL